ncbi:hypothetical protein AWC38_SpisGene23477 [Stylophora pistillata]|uniref:Uncharacterized protein n=1 Tax=Stylophora pistillata TaxID=50429 RepID=A0A2B4R5W2_STYPI|nr:hypothetical protein AWC38_SpisGene23477 [Stylophora pistillata]
MAVLAAEKLAAMTDAKLTAIERSMEEEEERFHPLSRASTTEDTRCRTQAWVKETTHIADKPNATPPEVPVTSGLERNYDGDTTVPINLPTPMHSLPRERPKSNQYAPLSQTPKTSGEIARAVVGLLAKP